MKLRFTVIGREVFGEGFTITQINPSPNKEYIRQSGYHPKVLPPIRSMGVFVDINKIRQFRGVLNKTYQVMHL